MEGSGSVKFKMNKSALEDLMKYIESIAPHVWVEISDEGININAVNATKTAGTQITLKKINLENFAGVEGIIPCIL